MPKTYSKAQSKKVKPRKLQSKAQAKPVSLLKSKYYWITLTLIVLVFTIVYGYLTKISFEKETLMLGSIISVIGFAFYIGFKNNANYDKRATFIFVGAALIGFGIWALIVFSFSAAGIYTQIANTVGSEFFAITSQVIFLVIGALIGDIIGKNRKALKLFFKQIQKLMDLPILSHSLSFPQKL